MTTQSFVDTDATAQLSGKPELAQYLKHAQDKIGAGYFKIIRDFYTLKKGIGRIPLEEYVQYGLYDPDMSQDDKGQFISNSLHWPITHVVCDMTWQATTEDKWLLAKILENSNIAIPKTLAIIDTGIRKYPDTKVIRDQEALLSFLKDYKDTPLFVKQNRGIASFGAFVIEGIEGDQIKVKDRGLISAETLIDDAIGENSFIVQKVAQNHPDIAAYTSTLATVRVCILSDENGVHIPFTVLKLPNSANVADAFWRPGNLACEVDVDTGVIRQAKTKHFLGTENHSIHPESNLPLIGVQLPDWQKLKHVVHECAPIFEGVRYQSMDIALTPEGPLVVEVNTGGGFDLPQLATGKGFLTDEVRQFFIKHGYETLRKKSW